MECDDVFGFLPKLNDSTEIKEEDYEVDSTWYNSFVDNVTEDLDPKKLHDLVLDYLVCNGFKEAAELLCADSETDFPRNPNISSLEKRDAIRNAIVDGDIEGATVQINELSPNLLADNPKLHFKILRQQLVELIRNKKIERALNFAQENLMDKYEQPPDLFVKLEQTYALLAFDRPECSPFSYLMHTNQRNMLASEVNSVILSTLEANPVSKLEHLFRIMVWNQHQLKTKGDARPLTTEVTAQIAKGLFAPSEEPNSEFL